uniref:Uncharacterized protein n=1 Tax=Arundo donax TaxID=35708 RepID=A0A0A9AUA6_ARUDO
MAQREVGGARVSPLLPRWIPLAVSAGQRQ